MKIVLKGSAEFLKHRIAGILLALIVLSPVAAFSQEPNPDETDPAEMTVPEPSSATSTTPWDNSAGSRVGTRDNSTSSSASSAPASVPRLGRPSGPTIDDRDPVGNPDVPFDDNMNLAFLAAGILFAVFIVRKKFIARTVPLN